MINPEYFSWGNAFNQGIQQSQENKRRNALLDLEQRQYGLQERRLGMAEKEYADEQQRRAEAMQQAQANESRGYKALAAARGDRASGVALLQEIGLPVELADDPDSAELYAALAEKFGGFSLNRGQPANASSIQEFEAAKATGFGGSYLDFVRQKAQAGQAPPTPGFTPVQLADGSYGSFDQRTGRIVPTGQLAPKKQPAVDPAAAAQNKATDAQNVINAIDDATALAGFFTTGLVGQVIGNIGGTDAYNLRSAVDTIKANVGFDRLQRMREESKTGGALGQVAVQELNLLQATIASLDPNQREDVLRRNLRRVRNQYQKAMDAYQRSAAQGPNNSVMNQSGVVDFASLPEK